MARPGLREGPLLDSPPNGKVEANENRHEDAAGRVRRYRCFESGFLQRRVSCEPIEIDKCAQCQPSIFRPLSRETPPSSEELARAYKPYIETCISAFGPDRGIAVDPPQAL
jgi:hypothetical protein